MKRKVARVVSPPARAYVRHAPPQVPKTMLLRRLLEPALRSDARSFVTTTVDGVTMAGNTADMIQRYLYLFGVWEPALTAWLRPRLLPGRTFVDVGANIGYFSLLAARLGGPTSRVVAVEALPATFTLLKANLARNDSSNVRAVNVAASREPGVLTLYGGEPHNSGTTSTIATPGLAALTQVDARPLAALLTEEEVKTTRVVKVDVEGAERDVIAGLLPALGHLPDDVEIVVELTPGSDDVIRTLAQAGFHAYAMRNDYRLSSYARPQAPEAPVRFVGRLTERVDLVFSRVDAVLLG